MLVSMFPTKTRKNPRKFFVVFRKCHILGAEIEGQRQGNNRPPLTGYFKMFKQYQPVNGNIVFKKADEDAKMKELVFENGYVVEYEEALNVANAYPMTVKFAISAQTVKMDEATFTQDWPENN